MRKRRGTGDGIYRVLHGDSCIYCGVVAECRDHAYPVFAEPSLAPDGMLIVVPSCHSCNQIAGLSIHDSLDERREHIHSALRSTNHSLLSTPEWTDEELAEVEGQLRESILVALAAKRRLVLRLTYRPRWHVGVIPDETTDLGGQYPHADEKN